MNVIAPDLIWIEGRCYRVNDCQPELSSFNEYDLYESDNLTNQEMEEDFDPTIEMTGSDKFTTSIHIPSSYFGVVIGARGATRRRIESETKTRINVPRMGQNGDVTISGPTYMNVAKAKQRLNLIISGARQKQRPTHFLSIPINAEAIVTNYKKFKELVLSENAQGVEESVFIPAEKLHLTLAIMPLMDDEERLLASQLLKEAKTQIVEPLIKEPLNIVIKGISYWEDDPRDVHVLFGNVCDDSEKNNDIMETLANRLNDFFYQKDFAKKENNGVKLHMTLMNTSYRNDNDSKGDSGNPGVKRKLRQSFDASKILETYRDFHFGVQIIPNAFSWS